MKISTGMVKGIVILIGAWFVLTPLVAFAANKVVVIPLFGSEQLKNVIIVAPANANFTDPVAAVESVGSSASASNPYMVVIRPGVYTITRTLVMKPYVDIVGSGESVTSIRGGISASIAWTSAIIKGANNAALSSLTVENTGGGSLSIALFNESASPKVTNVTATASGATYSNHGVINYSSSNPTMTNVIATASASGGTASNYGVANSSSNPTMTNVTATASGGSSSNGVDNYSSNPTMTNVTAMATGASNNNYGVYNSSSNPTMTNVTALASGGTYSCGVYNNYASPIIIRSTMLGIAEGLKTVGGSADLRQSTVWYGALVESGGENVCVLCDNESGKLLNPNCTEPP